MNHIFTRVSIRKYQNRPVEKEKTLAILRAAMQAPSAANQQPWEFFVVTNKEKLLALSKVHPYSGMVKNAPVAIVAAYRKECALPDYAQIDLSIAMECRCYRGGKGRTKMTVMKLRASDILWCVVAAVFVVGIVLLNTLPAPFKL